MIKRSSQLVHPFVLPMPDEKEEESHINIIDWVNKKGQGSTIFVSFGSEYFLDKRRDE